MPLDLWKRLSRTFAFMLRDRSGATALFFALLMVPILGTVGLAVDGSRGYLLESRLSKALDTAALAGGRVALRADAEAITRQYFNANFGTGAGDVGMTFTLDPTRQFVTLSAEARTPTVFMRIFGRDEMNVSARVVIQRQTTGMELALVMDNTGSMWGSPFNAMQAAAFDLVDIIYGPETSIDRLWLSLVPYTATVNIGPSRTGWLAPTDPAVVDPAAFSAAGWKGCVMARNLPRDTNDDPPSVEPFRAFYYAPTPGFPNDNDWGGSRIPPLRTELSARNAGYGPNLGCGPPITPLTASRATIDAAIGDMGAWHRGGTTGNLGLTWGWRTLSPRWKGLWGGETPANQPFDYDEPYMQKVVVILTDGNNQFYDHDTANNPPRSDYTSYGRLEALGVTSLAAGRTLLDQRMAGTCTAMKAQGIQIYSIIFGSAPDATARTLFQNCASGIARYFFAPNNATLAQAFRTIAGELASLRIVE